ncbi:Hypothetical protein SCF082_LOCUS44884 [Durusdinium trenchii]|uniref:Apple domain-containing protein n=1 Tax=Durusdinium trenchii TaxID=1381693 RepID=A0ABP0R647_9DINO
MLTRPKIRWRRRIWLLLLGTSAAQATDMFSVKQNGTAAALATGEIAAKAATAAGASPEEVVKSAANTAGIKAAETARNAGMTEPQVEAAAADAAESAAKIAGATKNEAARAAGQTAVEVSSASKVTPGPPLASDNAWSLVPGTDCLSWWGDGCLSITQKDACVSSRDGSDIAMREGGVKVFGEPCVWCGGGSCDDKADMAAVCSPRSMLPKELPSEFVKADCQGQAAINGKRSSELWQQTVPEQLRAGGFAGRDINFEHLDASNARPELELLNPGGGNQEGSSNYACRASNINDASVADPYSRNYYSVWTADLEECFDICSWKQDCTGIEHERKNNYCEVWNTPIQWVSPMPDYKCFRAMPPTSNASASTVKWRVTDTLSVEQSSDGAPLPWLFWALGGLIAIGVIVAICVVWRSRKKKSKKSTKRSVETEEKGGEQGEQVGSGDERQPLVGTSMPNGSSMPSFAGSFSNLSTGPGHSLGQNFGQNFGQNWYQTPSFASVGSGYDSSRSGYGGYGYEAVGAQTDGNTYLQQLRQWLQQYETARFQELTHLQSQAPPGWGQASNWSS